MPDPNKPMPMDEWKSMPEEVRHSALAGLHAKLGSEICSKHFIPQLDKEVAAGKPIGDLVAVIMDREDPLAEDRDTWPTIEASGKPAKFSTRVRDRAAWRQHLIEFQRAHQAEIPELDYGPIVDALADRPTDGSRGARYWVVVHAYSFHTATPGTTVASTDRGALEPDAPVRNFNDQ